LVRIPAERHYRYYRYCRHYRKKGRVRMVSKVLIGEHLPCELKCMVLNIHCFVTVLYHMPTGVFKRSKSIIIIIIE
jgi:hypothetical protein